MVFVIVLLIISTIVGFDQRHMDSEFGLKVLKYNQSAYFWMLLGLSSRILNYKLLEINNSESHWPESCHIHMTA